MVRLEEQYKEKIIPALLNEFKYSNKMQVPKLETIFISMGLGRAIQDKKILELALDVQHACLARLHSPGTIDAMARAVRPPMEIGVKA